MDLDISDVFYTSNFELQDLGDVEIQTGIYMFFFGLFCRLTNEKRQIFSYLQNNRPDGSLEDFIR